MQKKRLAVILYHTCPLSDEVDAEIGGANTYVLELSKAMAKLGYQLDIFTRLQEPQSPRVVDVEEGLRVIHLPAGPEAKINKKEQEQYIPEFLNNFYSFIEKEDIQYSYVSCHYFLSGIVGLDIKEKLHIPLVMTFHTLGLMKNLVARSDEERESVQRIRTEINLVKHADKIIATSEDDAEYIQTLYKGSPEKIAILIPGVDLELFRPGDKIAAREAIGADSDHRVILFVGRIEPLKGIDVLLYAIKMLMHKKPELKMCLWIVGGDISKASDAWSKELQKLNAIRNILELDAAVKFVGRKEQDELPNYYNAAEILVLPSQYESFGITAVEAMASGVPVITTDVAGVSDFIDKEHAELIISANNPILLAEKMESILEDEKEYDRLSKAVAKSAQDLSWENTAKQFMKLCISCEKKH